MTIGSHLWCVVLASQTVPSCPALATPVDGVSVPPQYAVVDGETPLEATLRRGRALAPAERTLAVVHAAHRPFWKAHLSMLPERHTLAVWTALDDAAALLAAVATTLKRDPTAVIVTLPAWLAALDEALLAQAIVQAVALSEPVASTVSVVADRAPSAPGDGASVSHVLRPMGIAAGHVSAWLRLFQRAMPVPLRATLIPLRHAGDLPGVWEHVVSAAPRVTLRDLFVGHPHLVRAVKLEGGGLADLRDPVQVERFLAARSPRVSGIYAPLAQTGDRGDLPRNAATAAPHRSPPRSAGDS
ncbi:MAG: hypothetical protein KC543_05190 [Myxococcales bacterium]|nr:hypothetical protein [Myxococcales bacterium]